MIDNVSDAVLNVLVNANNGYRASMAAKGVFGVVGI